jgi:membrane fusion protein (multidrug efflux system)
MSPQSLYFLKTKARVLADRYDSAVGTLIFGTVLFLTWISWFFLSEITLYETSQDSRIELRQQNFLIEPQVSGKLATTRLILGKICSQGEVVAEIESKYEALALKETQAQWRESQTSLLFADEEMKRLKNLRSVGYIPEIEYLRAEANQKKASAATEALSATLEKLKFELERRKIRCPVSGPIAECEDHLNPGSLVSAGERLGSILPPGELRGVAYFSPGVGLGKIRPGQQLNLRLQAFPWTEYGALRGAVVNVASEIREGKVRVEFSLENLESFPIPLRHGYPGTVEVAVEKVSPAKMALRTAGAMSLVRTAGRGTP